MLRDIRKKEFPVQIVRLIAPDLKSCGITVGELPPDTSLKGSGAGNE